MSKCSEAGAKDDHSSEVMCGAIGASMTSKTRRASKCACADVGELLPNKKKVSTVQQTVVGRKITEIAMSTKRVG